MGKLKIRLLFAHINKLITAGNEIYNLPDTNVAKKFLKSMGGIAILKDSSSISDMEVIDIKSNKRIGLINAFNVLDKGTNAIIGSNNLEAGEYIALPNLQGLKQLQTILNTHVNNNHPNYKEREVGFKVITNELESQIVDNFSDTASNISGYSGLSNISDVSFTGGVMQDTSTLVATHQEEVRNLNAQITALRQECEHIRENARNQEQLLREQVNQLQPKVEQVNQLQTKVKQMEDDMELQRQNADICQISTSDVKINGKSYVKIRIHNYRFSLHLGNKESHMSDMNSDAFSVKSQ